MTDHHHRSTLSQKNKPFKRRFATKGEIKRKNKGKVSSPAAKVSERQSVKKCNQEAVKDQRKNKARQQREEKRQDVLTSRRLQAQGEAPPKLVVIIPLAEKVNAEAIVQEITKLDDIQRFVLCSSAPSTQICNQGDVLYSKTWKTRVTFRVAPNYRSGPPAFLQTLDLAKVADLLMFVVPDPSGVDDHGEDMIRLISIQGMGAALCCLQGQTAARSPLRRQLEKDFEIFFGRDTKVIPLPSVSLSVTGEKEGTMEEHSNRKKDNVSSQQEEGEQGQQQQMKNLMRMLCQTKSQPPPVSKFTPRPYIVVDQFEFKESQSTLCVKGYLRGGALNTSQLLHFPDFDDFQVANVFRLVDPASIRHSTSSSPSAAPEQLQQMMRESLEQENEPDPLEGEQNLSEEEEGSHSLRSHKKKVPKGFSDYQAAWIAHNGSESDGDEAVLLSLQNIHEMSEDQQHDDEEEDGNDDDDEEDDDDDDDDEDQEDSIRFDRKGKRRAQKIDEDEADFSLLDDEEDDESRLSRRRNDDTERRAHLEKKRQEEEEDMKFPDEVDTPDDVDARIRFSKFRGLKSFRTSRWDEKEDLPRDYAKIFQFQNFSRTQSRVLQEVQEADGGIAQLGFYLQLDIDNFPSDYAAVLFDRFLASSSPLILFGLFQYERKLSVLHSIVKRTADYSEPIRNKEELIMQIGFRRIRANPLFSENNLNCGKHKMERFFPTETTCIASVYSNITFLPSTVLMFKQPQEDPNQLIFVADGSLQSINPDRLIVKRATLSGYPFRVHKTRSVIRWMFFNPLDIRWFKPVELHTKHGRIGHILEPLGTHGYMKCQFDNRLNPNDTVLMHLYKRVYPKWRARYLHL